VSCFSPHFPSSPGSVFASALPLRLAAQHGSKGRQTRFDAPRRLAYFSRSPCSWNRLGTIQIVYPPYETLYDGRVVNHAHNDYLEALAETGILGALCCAWFIAILFLAALRSLQEATHTFAAVLRLAALVGCCGILVHSLVDFNLHIPANAFFFFLMALLAASPLPLAPPVTVPAVRRRDTPRNP